MRSLWLLLLLLVAACTKELTDLQPYPCPADNNCPSPLVCVAGVCAPVQADVDCSHANVDCSAVGGCWKNKVCEPTCGADAGSCAADRVCAGGACLVDCTQTSTCPAGLACRLVGNGPTRACMPTTINIPACMSFVPRATNECFTNCPGVNDVACSTGGYCPTHSICDAPSHCTCNAGWNGIKCSNGLVCNSSTNPCGANEWMCEWNTPAATCASTDPGPGICTCKNGMTLERGCTATPCEQLCDTAQSQ
jgi:hypothetical protein